MASAAKIILGIDPGTSNGAYGVIKVQANPFKYQVLEHGMIKDTLTCLTGADIGKRAALFQKEIRKIVRKYKVNYLIAERFQTRGPKGVTVELVGVMLGLLMNVGVKDVAYITAAQWKNQWNKQSCLDDFYEDAHAVGIVAHQVDAVNIGFYGANVWLDVEKFPHLSDVRLFLRRLTKSNIGNYNDVRKYHNEEKKSRGKGKRKAKRSTTKRSTTKRK